MQLIVPSDSRREHKVKYFHQKENKKASQAAKTNRWNTFRHFYREIGLHQGRPGALNALRFMDTKKGYLFGSTKRRDLLIRHCPPRRTRTHCSTFRTRT